MIQGIYTDINGGRTVEVETHDNRTLRITTYRDGSMNVVVYDKDFHINEHLMVRDIDHIRELFA